MGSCGVHLLYIINREDFSNQLTLKWRPSGSEGAGYLAVLGKSVLGRRNIKCKGPEAVFAQFEMVENELWLAGRSCRAF